MRKLFSIFSFVLLFSVISFGQAQIDVSLTAVSGPNNQAMAVGLDQTATPGIDPALGESILPPPPPSGAFDVRFDLAPYGGGAFASLRDYRLAAAYPFTGVTTHLLRFQLATGQTTLAVQYEVPAGAVMVITDNITGTFYPSGPLTGTGSYSLPTDLVGIGAARVVMTYTNISPAVVGPAILQ